MPIDDYKKKINFQDIPEKTSADPTDRFVIQNINEENASVQKQHVVFPIEQTVLGNYTKTQQNLKRIREILDALRPIIKQDDIQAVLASIDDNYTASLNNVLYETQQANNTLQAQIQSMDFDQLSSGYVEGVDPTAYFDSGWNPITSSCMEIKHSMGTLPKTVRLSYRLNQEFLDWPIGTVFYDEMPIATNIQTYVGGKKHYPNVIFIRPVISFDTQYISLSLPYPHDPAGGSQFTRINVNNSITKIIDPLNGANITKKPLTGVDQYYAFDFRFILYKNV